jgi:adenylate cyclase
MKPWWDLAAHAGHSQKRWLARINYGTTKYPPKVARRLRALNITTWSAAGVGGLFAIIDLFDPAPHAWRVGLVNVMGTIALSAIPLLHRFGSTVGPVAFASIIYVNIFVTCSLIGTDTGMQMQFLAVAAGTILFLGTDHPRLIALFSLSAVILIFALQIYVPHNTGLFPASTVFVNFVIGIPLTCAILCSVVYYAVREAARAEATAEREFARSEALLENILPASIAVRLKNRAQAVIADRFDGASVLFADMAGFTARTSDTPPDQLVLFLNRVFSDFDRLVESHGLEKIKTTGDAYMVVSGVPTARLDHARALALLALDMRASAADLNDLQGRRVPIRIGMASGPVVAGVVGTRKFFYDVWGDAVNVASRMESSGEEGKIQVSEAIHDQLKDEFELEARGPVEIKGKGRIQTWFLIDRKRAAS